MGLRRTGVFLALLVLVSVSVQAQSSFFRPFTFFRVIRTEHFDIIFPAESEASARALAEHADWIYEKMTGLLGIEIPFRLPVVFNPHTGLFNGLYSMFPNPHIVLFDTPMDIEWTTFPDSMMGLFIHELAHAVSLNSMTPFGRRAHRVFGSWVSQAPFVAPLFAVEGVAVLFESLSGFGRANDPLFRQHLRQAVHEDRFLTPLQAAGLYDLPTRMFFHEYGGLFSAWLFRNHGMEKYAELWRAIARGGGFSFSPHRSGYFRLFREIFGVDFLDEWAAFRDSFALDGLEENRDEVFQRRYRFLTERHRTVSRLATDGAGVFVLDGREGRVRVYDTRTGAVRSFNVGLMNAYDIDVSVCGSTVLVSGYRFVGDRFEAVVREYRADTGRGTGRSFRGLYRARYFRDGVIGIRSDLHDTVMVFERFGGGREVLFRGNPRLLFSGPQVIDDDRVAFVAARGGARELWIYDRAAGSLFRVESSCGRDGYWTHMRGLGASDGKLLFGHNADDRMFKLAVIDLENMSAVFSERDFSGGVFNPVSVGGVIYYRGEFAAGDRLLRFPETLGSVSGTRTGLRLVELDRLTFEAIPAPPAANGETGPGAEDEPEAVGETGGPVVAALFETAPERAAFPEPAFAETRLPETSIFDPPVSEARDFRASRYFAVRYMNPFRAWIPLPLIRVVENGDDFTMSLDGGGIFSMMADPTQRNFVHFAAFVDARYRMVTVPTFSWQNTVPGFPLTFGFSDTVVDFDETVFRDTRASISGSLTRSVGRAAVSVALTGSYVRRADRGDADENTSAYRWEKTGSLFAVSPGVAFSTRRRRPSDVFGTGLSLSVVGATPVSAFEPYAAGMFRATAETRFPVSAAFFGAFDQSGMDMHGVSARFGRPVFSEFAPTEFRRHTSLDLNWIGGAEFGIGLFSLEIQGNVSHVYFNRLFGTLAVRSAFYEGRNHPNAEGFALGDFHGLRDLRLAQSLVLRLGMVTSFRLGSFPIFFEPNVWGAWKFSNTVTDRGSRWHVGMGFTVR